jgi:O-antigen/teichoic acid export membrane protein
VLGGAPALRPGGIDGASVAILAAGIVGLGLADGGFVLSLALHRFRTQALVQPLFVWLYAATLLLVWQLHGLDVHEALILWVVFQILGALPLYALGIRHAGLGRPSMPLLRETWRFGVRAWLGSLATYLGFRLDQVLMGFMSTRAELGLYAVAVNAAEIPLYVPQSVSNTLLPIVAADEGERRQARAIRVYRLVTLLTLALVLAGMAAGPFLIPFAFGDAFEGSVSPFLWLLPGAVGFVASSIFSAALAATSAPGLSSVGPAATLVVGLALDVVLIPRLGADGAAIASTAGFIAGGAAAVLAFRKTAPLRWTDLLPRRHDVSEALATIRRPRA